MDNQNTDKIIREVISKMGGAKQGNLNEADIRKQIRTIDKNTAINKLNSMGLGAVAQKLKTMSDEDIMREISKNPSVIKKLNSILNK